MSKPDVSLIIPAYNETERIGNVLDVVTKCRSLADICVVNDGSGDETSSVARAFSGVTVIDLPHNMGKGAAMYCGAASCRTPVVAFLDADLVGLQPDHLETLTEPMRKGKADMTIAVFRGGRFRTDFSHAIAGWVTGQRAMRRELVLALPQIACTRFGVETIITREALRNAWRVGKVSWRGVTHVMREEKLGAFPGFASRLRMYGDIAHAFVNGRPNPQSTSAAQSLLAWVGAHESHDGPRHRP